MNQSVVKQSIVEAHPRLHHYTTAVGLRGIIESQQLWATSIAYLNDAEEHTGFYDRRLRYLMLPPVRDGFVQIASTATGRAAMVKLGGIEAAAARSVEEMATLIREATLRFNNPFITSFCGLPERHPDDGLLSQWRGYGSDGGYAIEFDTAALEGLLKIEESTFYYQYSMWGDVEYYDQDTGEATTQPETIEWEQVLQNAIRAYVIKPTADRLGNLLEPITALSCLHKHRGFSEEAEVRIVALPTNDEIFQEALKQGEKRPRRPIEFRPKNGVLVPYILLFGSGTKLPIRKILVGPHPDKIKRQRAVQMLLEKHGVEADVLVSDIPYLGR
ncbi:MAG: hypothetical protein JWQ21_1384 [Herminiimonas sp.]|nr:hypothetical protein [Herminiimonas sp.]